MMKRLAMTLAFSGMLAPLPSEAADPGPAPSLYVAAPPVTASAPVYTGWREFTFTLENPPTANLDYGVAHLPFPSDFKFMFYDREYDAVDVSADGLLLFGNTVDGVRGVCKGALAPCGNSQPIPSALAPNGLVAFWWSDMKLGPPAPPPGSTDAGVTAPSTVGASLFTTSGTAPDRVFSVRLEGWGAYDAQLPLRQRTVQIDLHESNGAIAIYYGAIGDGTKGSTKASVGIEDRTGAKGVAALDCTNLTGDRCTDAHWPAGQVIRISPRPEPDLVITSLEASALVPATLEGGGDGYQVDLTLGVANQGQGTATGFTYELYLSADDKLDLDGTDTLLKTHEPLETLGGRATTVYVEPGVKFARPAHAGTFRILARIDSAEAVAEWDETNNVRASGEFLVGIDLAVTDFELTGPPAATPGEEVTVHVVIRNRGTDLSGGFDYRVYLSGASSAAGFNPATAFPLTVPGTGGLGTAPSSLVRVADGIAGAQTYQADVKLKLPDVSEGSYNYFIVVDPPSTGAPNGAIAEVVENNNIARGAAGVVVALADLVITDVKLLSADDPNPEIDNPFFGERVRVQWTMKNIGRGPARNFNVGVVLSDNVQITTHDIAMFPAVPSCSQGLTVMPNETRTVSCDYTMPSRDLAGSDLKDGIYYIGVILDVLGVIGGEDKSNNIGRTENELLCRQPAMDLAAVRLEAPSVGAVGELMPVHRTIRNFGNRGNEAAPAEPFDYRFVLSSNEIISADDIPLVFVDGAELSTDGRGRLPVAGESTATELVLIPYDVSPGTYFVGLVLDPANKIRELDETNNVVGALGTIEVAAASLRVETTGLRDALLGADYRVQLVASGGDGNHVWSLEPGQGELPAGLSLGSDGVLGGVPEKEGLALFTVRVTSANRSGFARLALRTLAPSGAFGILSSRLPSAIKDRAYSVKLVAVGGMPPYRWAVIDGAPPSGLTLSPEGVLSGKLAAVSSGLSGFRVSATDAYGNRAEAALTLGTLEPSSLYIATVRLAEAQAGASYIQQLQAENGVGERRWTVRAGALPEGVRLSASGVHGDLTGKPVRPGLYPVTIEVADAAGSTDSADFILTVLPRAAEWSGATMPEATPGAQYLADLTGSAVTGSRFTIYGGELPPGLTLERAGRISGTVSNRAAPRSYDFILEIVEPSGASALIPATIRVVAKEVPLRTPDAGGCSSAGGGVAPWFLVVLLAAPLLRARRGRWSRGATAGLGGLLLLVVLALPGVAAANYDVTSAQRPFEPIDGAPVALSSSSVQATVELPFSFRYWAGSVPNVMATHTSIAVGCRGVITFAVDPSKGGPPANSASMVGQGIPGTAASFPLIAPWWGNWDCAPGAVTTAVSGSAPYRVFTVQWRDVWVQGDEGRSANGATFQVKLYETLDRVELAYGPSRLSQSGKIVSAAAGIAQNGVTGLPALFATGVVCTTRQPASGTGANCKASDFPSNTVVVFKRPADLRLTRVYADDVGYAGVPMPMGATVWNDGGEPALGVAVRFYLSTNATFELAKDVELGTSRSIELHVNQRRDLFFAPALPRTLSPGTYHLFARVDPDNKVTETDETNNLGPAGGLKFVVAEPQGDLAAGPISGPQTAKPGEAITLDVTVRNLGNRLLGPCGDDAACDAGLTCEAGRCLSPCAGGEVCPDGLSCDAETQLCEATCADDAACADGESCHGGRCAPRPIPYALYLSDNTTITPADTRLSPEPAPTLVGGLGAFGERSVIASVNLPAKLRPGQYCIGMIADPEGLIPESSETNNASLEPWCFAVMVDSLGFVSTTLPDATAQSPYGARLKAAGGTGVHVFSLVSGALPPGLSLVHTGDIAGVPLAAADEPWEFEVQVASGTRTARGSFSLAVQPPGIGLGVVTRALPAGEFGLPYRVGLSALGGVAPYAWSLKSGNLIAPGLVLSSGGVIEGKPGLNGSFAFEVEVEDSAGARAAASLTLEVAGRDRLQITGGGRVQAVLGEPFAADVFVAGGRAPYTWSLVETRMMPLDPTEMPAAASGEPPPGVVLLTDRAVAHLSGKPLRVGVWTMTLKVVDATGAEDNTTLAIEVRADRGLEILTTALPDAIVGRAYQTQLKVPEGEEVVWSLTCQRTFGPDGVLLPCPAALPPGFSLTQEGLLGTGENPVEAPEVDPDTGKSPPRTTYSFLVKARDGQNRTAVRAMSVTVRVDEPPEQPPAEGCGCAAGGGGAGVASAAGALIAAMGLARRRRRD